MSVAEQVEEVRSHYRHALTRIQALVLLAAERDGTPLYPDRPDDAVVVLRAEQLVAAGAKVRDAIAQPRAEVPRLPASCGSGAASRPLGRELPPAPPQPVCGNDQHVKVWGARDGIWRSLTTDPPALAGEIVQTRADEEAAGPSTI